MKTIRNAMFETNSSSVHTITLGVGDYTPSRLPLDKHGTITIYPGEFSWGPSVFTDAATKASYALTYIKTVSKSDSELKLLEQVIRSVTGKRVKFSADGDDDVWPWGYIDHQSVHTLKPIIQEKALQRFIFDPSSQLIIDNDNY